MARANHAFLSFNNSFSQAQHSLHCLYLVVERCRRTHPMHLPSEQSASKMLEKLQASLKRPQELAKYLIELSAAFHQQAPQLLVLLGQVGRLHFYQLFKMLPAASAHAIL